MLHVNKIKKDDLRRSLETYCRTRTSLPGVMENIRYGKLDATAEEVARRRNWATRTALSGDCRKVTLCFRGRRKLKSGTETASGIARAAVADRRY